MGKVSKIAGWRLFLGGKNGLGSKVRVEKYKMRGKNLIIKTDTLQIRILELIGLLGEATSDENKCISKAICISFAAVQTKMFSDENTPLKDKSVVLIADPADCAEGNITLEKYSSMEIKKTGNAFCMLKLLLVIL